MINQDRQIGFYKKIKYKKFNFNRPLIICIIIIIIMGIFIICYKLIRI